MGLGANADDIDGLRDFRIQLIKFKEAAGTALGDAETDIQRTVMWLENDQQYYWQGQIRNRQEVLKRAQEALRQKQVFKDATGRVPSAVEEQKAVQAAQKRLVEAEEKLAKVKSWHKKLQKEALLYKGTVQRFATAVMSDIPNAIAHLGALADRLDEYVALGPAGGGMQLDDQTAGYFGVAPTGSMARGTATPMPAAPLGYAELRTRLPPAPARREAPKVDQAPAPGAASAISDDQAKRLAELPLDWHAPNKDDYVTLGHNLAAAQRIVFDRNDAGWYIGAADAPAQQELTAVKVSALMAARPDLRQVLALPQGFLVILDKAGLTDVVSDRDVNIWTSSPPPAAG